ncbi:uncharacterized protein LOC8069253 [Sorghum bicolor]|uniref:uncharacterized protein LOC8069253 n=1 Tax=Sorghum bicolor TaxID=4558 RepID=UPI000B4238A0|nr:uncharacterized protein LOC8069253 [Sorghum bicolor]|eukprot:XP_021317048.1 uncharacterized protein LOC8069253 [Sorghum bicolor]
MEVAMGDDSSGCSLRRVARRPSYMYVPTSKEHAETWSRLISKIESSYKEAQLRLAVAVRGTKRPATTLLDAGVCIGLLDPVSNIMVNTICTSDRWPEPDLQEKVLLAAGGSVVVDDDDERLDQMRRRSLLGLVAFLVYFFPYLAEWEAVRYLLLADADLLCAVRTIVADRGMLLRFSLDSPVSAPAVEAALALAAQVAKHPEPNHLVRVWMLLSSRPHQAAFSLLSDQQHSSSPIEDDLDRRWFKAMLHDPVAPNLAISWDLAASRAPYSNAAITNMPYQHTRSLQMVLLDTIHGFYLQALARLPCGELRSHLHRSLLMAGYCYGPMDPVSNIIYNTIWHHANFPAAVTPVLEVIGPKSLTRLETRSFYGLVSFILTRYHHLSGHQAVQCLIAACGQLSLADPKLTIMSAGDDQVAKGEQEQQHHHQRRSSDSHHLCHCMWNHYDEVIRNVEQQSPSTSVQEAYMAAAIAAWHPNPDEHATFLASWKGDPVVMNQLTSEDVHHWSKLMSPEQPPTPERVCKSGYPVRCGKKRSLAQQRRVSRKVKAALHKHLLQDGKPAYDLHIISCVNEDVCGPEYCDDIDESLSCAPYRYLYTHVNFLATRKDSLSSASYPTLFFAEFDNEKEDSAPLVCCPVQEPIAFAA